MNNEILIIYTNYFFGGRALLNKKNNCGKINTYFTAENVYKYDIDNEHLLLDI